VASKNRQFEATMFRQRQFALAAFTICCVIAAPGCTGAKYKDGDARASKSVKEKAEVKDKAVLLREAPQAAIVDSSGSMAANRAAGDLQRKIIYDLFLSVVVADFSPVQQRVEEAVRQSPQSYISAANVTGERGSRRSGRWTIKVPQDQSDGLIQQLRSLGEVQEERKSSQEVTDEYYDLKARLKNKQETEKRILALQQERKGELKDIVAVEEQVDKVRGEIETMQGRLNRLEHLTSLVTVTLEVNEIREYTPESPIAFNDRATSTFQSSWQNMKEAGEGAALAAVALAPWAPLLVVGAIALRWLWRRIWRPFSLGRKQGATKTAAEK
jgi:hypothetical protein